MLPKHLGTCDDLIQGGIAAWITMLPSPPNPVVLSQVGLAIANFGDQFLQSLTGTSHNRHKDLEIFAIDVREEIRVVF